MATIVIYVWVQASSAPIVFLSKEHALCVMAGEYLMTIVSIAINRFIGVFIAMVLVRILLVADNVHFAEVTASLL